MTYERTIYDVAYGFKNTAQFENRVQNVRCDCLACGAALDRHDDWTAFAKTNKHNAYKYTWMCTKCPAVHKVFYIVHKKKKTGIGGAYFTDIQVEEQTRKVIQ